MSAIHWRETKAVYECVALDAGHAGSARGIDRSRLGTSQAVRLAGHAIVVHSHVVRRRAVVVCQNAGASFQLICRDTNCAGRLIRAFYTEFSTGDALASSILVVAFHAGSAGCIRRALLAELFTQQTLA